MKGEIIMTLYDLVNSTTVQGDIRLSVWTSGWSGTEVAVEQYTTEDLSIKDISPYEDLKVNYIFSASDGKLHIELEG